MTTLADIAKVVRSKNAGPTLLTIDVILADEAGFGLVSDALTVEAVAQRYRVDETQVDIIAYRPALAFKVVLPRRVSAGGFGDRDIYGAQQHVPLLGLPV